MALPMTKSVAGIGMTSSRTRTRMIERLREKGIRDETFYWVGPAGAAKEAGEGTDFYAIAQNQVSITPLHLDFTHHATLPEIGEWLCP